MKRQTLYLAAWASTAMPAALSAGPASGVYYDIQAQAVSGSGSQNVRGAFIPQTARPPAAPSQLTTSPLTVTLAVYTDNRGTSAMNLLVPFAPGVGQVRINKSAFPPEARPVAGILEELVYSSPYGGYITTTETRVINLLGKDGKVEGKTYHVTDATGLPATDPGIILEITAGAGPPEITHQRISTETDGSFIIPAMASGTNYGFNASLYATDAKTGMQVTFPSMGYVFMPANGASTFTLPLLNDWNTTTAGVKQFGGQILDIDGKPMPDKEVMVMVSGMAWPGDMPIIQVRSGYDGRFRLAFQEQVGHTTPEMPLTVQMQFSDATRRRDGRQTLVPGYDNILQEQRVGTVTVELLDMQGKPLDFSTTPPLMVNSAGQAAGFLLDAAKTPSQFPLLLTPGASTTTPLLQPVDVPLPGEYVVMARGYLFPAQKAEKNGDKLVFRAQQNPFIVTGRVVNIAGDPIADAYVLLADAMNMAPKWSSINELETLARLWETTGGDFHKLGAYLARTGPDGTFSLSGDALQGGSYNVVHAAGYAPMRLYSGGRITYGMHGERSNMNWESNRITGKHDLGTVTLTQSATVTLELTPPPPERAKFPGLLPLNTKLMAPILDNPDGTLGPNPVITANTSTANADTSQGIFGRTWYTNQTYTSGVLTLSVPAETTFSLEIRAAYRTGSRTPAPEQTITVDRPLKAGETRDISGMVDKNLLVKP